jgi:uncharacterized membrane protein
MTDDGSGAGHVPAWRRPTRGEHRWPMAIVVLVAVALQLVLPDYLTLSSRWLLPVVQASLLVGLMLADPTRIERRAAGLRIASLTLIALVSLSNAVSAVRLIYGLVSGDAQLDAVPLLVGGAAVWVTNVIVFSLWYWDLDRGGPAARADADQVYPDFLFAQMQSPELAPPEWEPTYVDYLYVSFTNATAFSPTDVLPLSRWAKLTMMVQSAVGLVIARAVNTLR